MAKKKKPNNITPPRDGRAIKPTSKTHEKNQTEPGFRNRRKKK